LEEQKKIWVQDGFQKGVEEGKKSVPPTIVSSNGPSIDQEQIKKQIEKIKAEAIENKKKSVKKIMDQLFYALKGDLEQKEDLTSQSVIQILIKKYQGNYNFKITKGRI